MSNKTNAIALPLQQHWDRLKAAVQSSKARNTLLAYASDWRLFETWCIGNKLIPLPAMPETICLYLSELVPRCKVTTMQRALVGIADKHQAWAFQNLPDAQARRFRSPTTDITVRIAMKGFRRQKGVAKTKKAPLSVPDLRKIFMTMDDPDHPIAIRDRALLLVAVAGAFRRSELAAIQFEHLRFTDEGLVIFIPVPRPTKRARAKRSAFVAAAHYVRYVH